MTYIVTLGDPNNSTIPVFMDGEEIGSILITVDGQIYTWSINDKGRELGLVIQDLTSFRLESLQITIASMVERQMTRIKIGEPLLPIDFNPLDPELQRWIDDLSFGSALRHPLVYSVPYSSGMAPHCNHYLHYKLKERQEAFDQQEWHRYVYIHERPYRLWAFMKIHKTLPSKDYWEMLGCIWTDSDNIYQNLPDWKKLWKSKKPDRQLVMDEDEQKALEALPDTLTIYRGYQHSTGKNGLSWTLSEKRAKWFAYRYRRVDSPSYLAKVTVSKADVLAHFLGRGEEEIVIFYPAKSKPTIVRL